MLQPHLPAPPNRCTSSMQWRSQGALKYCPSLLQDSLSISLADQKAYIMSYEGLFITKGGVTLHIPLCDHSTTWLFTYSMTVTSTLDTWLTLDMTQHYNAHVPKWIMAWTSRTRHHSDLDNHRSPTAWHPHAGQQWHIDAKIGSPW